MLKWQCRHTDAMAERHLPCCCVKLLQTAICSMHVYIVMGLADWHDSIIVFRCCSVNTFACMTHSLLCGMPALEDVHHTWQRLLTKQFLGQCEACMALQAPAGHITADWNIIQACGIFAVSVSGHSSLPVLRNSMARAAVRCLQGLVTILLCTTSPIALGQSLFISPWCRDSDLHGLTCSITCNIKLHEHCIACLDTLLMLLNVQGVQGCDICC